MPGTKTDGTFSDKHFSEWFEKVKKLCIESGHLEVALVTIGKILIYTPPDPDGLWILSCVAEVLNAPEVDHMRDGFRVGSFNSRGVCDLDPSASSEKELAEQFRNKAEDLEQAGFYRFAVPLRSLAEEYDHEAERIIDEYQQGAKLPRSPKTSLNKPVFPGCRNWAGKPFTARTLPRILLVRNALIIRK